MTLPRFIGRSRSLTKKVYMTIRTGWNAMMNEGGSEKWSREGARRESSWRATKPYKLTQDVSVSVSPMFGITQKRVCERETWRLGWINWSITSAIPVCHELGIENWEGSYGVGSLFLYIRFSKIGDLSVDQNKSPRRIKIWWLGFSFYR